MLLPALVLLVAFACTSPIWYDDAGHYLVSYAWAEFGRECYPLQFSQGIISICDPASPFITLGPTVSWPGMWMIRLFGPGMFSLRLLMVIFSLLAIWKFLSLSASVTQPKKAFWAGMLVLGNIQMLTYGSQFLGEMPMLAGFFGGAYFLVKGVSKEGKWVQIAFALPFFLWSLITKEYFILPLGVGLMIATLLFFLRKDFGNGIKLVSCGIAIAVLFVGWQWVKWGTFETVSKAIAHRSSYTYEFLSFGWGETLPYLLKKPLIWLGLVALLYKVRIRRDGWDLLLLGLFLGQLGWFLASAGYDRFGFQLLFIPAIYLAEFVWFAWDRIGKRRSLKRVWQAGFVLFFVGLFWQKSLPELGDRFLHLSDINRDEKAVGAYVGNLPGTKIFTYDQQIIPFLPPTVNWELNDVVPSNKANCVPFASAKAGGLLLSGPYGQTEFNACADKLDGKQVMEIGEWKVILLKEEWDWGY